LVGGALGAMRKDISNLYITVTVRGKEREIILKAGKHADDIYAAIAGIP
jgi:ribosome-associated translation inhibitor RaiA